MPSTSRVDLIRALSHYDLGIIQTLQRLRAGRGHSDKVLVTSERGRFLLKCRRTDLDGVERLELAHGVQRYLARRGEPVVAAVPSRDQGRSVVYLDGTAYEMLPFVAGRRYPGSLAATAEAGACLARLHRCLSFFRAVGGLSKTSYHDSPALRRHLKVSLPERLPRSRSLAAVLEDLHFAYDDSAARVNRLGCEQWPSQVIHGDWHPGNLLYRDDCLVAALDFDTVRLALPVLDLANGLLQFSLLGGDPNPQRWRADLDQDRFGQFLAAYRTVREPGQQERQALPDLMVESLVAEAVVPIAATGSLGTLPGPDVLEAVLRKIKWLRTYREDLVLEAQRACEGQVGVQWASRPAARGQRRSGA